MTKQEFITALANTSNNESLDIITDMIAFALNNEKAEFEITEYRNGEIGFNFGFGGNVYYNYTISNFYGYLYVKFENEYSQTTGRAKGGTMTKIRFEMRLEDKLEKIERPYISLGRWLAQQMA